MTTEQELVALGAEVGRALQERGWWVATAESCTGGLVGHLLTETPGSSAWVSGGAITYSNEAKVSVLGVNSQTIERHGAVSAECAAEMAAGALRLLGADFALALTGIAGPGGGTAEKPVGLTFVALGCAPETGIASAVERHVWKGDRSQNKFESARAALQLLQRALHAARR
jgi:PncC family amidohydrolase